MEGLQMQSKDWLPLGVFAIGLIVALLIDQNLFKGKRPTTKQALLMTGVWVSVAMAYLVFYIYPSHGTDDAVLWGTAYVLEWSLAVDNLFVFIMIFEYFRVPPEYRRRILTYGIWGAIVARAILVGLGAQVVHEFHWLIYILGGVLLVSVIKMLRAGDEEDEIKADNWLIRQVRKVVPISDSFEGGKFIIFRPNVTLTAGTVVLITIELSDVLFSADSVPVVLSVVQNPFLALTSTLCAVLGLRALYFALEGLVNNLAYLKKGVMYVLLFIIGTLFLPLVSSWFGEERDFPIGIKLLIIVLILGTATIASIVKMKKDGPAPAKIPGMAYLDQITVPASRTSRVLPQGDTLDNGLQLVEDGLLRGDQLKLVLGIPGTRETKRKIVVLIDGSFSMFNLLMRPKRRRTGFLHLGRKEEVRPSAVEQTIHELAATLSYYSNDEVHVALACLGDGNGVLRLNNGQPLTYEDLKNLTVPKMQLGTAAMLDSAIRLYTQELTTEEGEELTFVVINDGDTPDDYADLITYAVDADHGDVKPAKVIFLLPEAVDTEGNYDSLEALDNLRTKTLDIFDLRHMAEMTSYSQLFGEPLYPSTEMVVSSGRVIGSDGATLLDMPEGVPGEFSVTLPEGVREVTLQLAGYPECEVRIEE